MGVWIVRVALNATFYTRIAGRQLEQIGSAHLGMFRTVIPAYIVTDLIFGLFLPTSSLRSALHWEAA